MPAEPNVKDAEASAPISEFRRPCTTTLCVPLQVQVTVDPGVTVTLLGDQYQSEPERCDVTVTCIGAGGGVGVGGGGACVGVGGTCVGVGGG